MVLRCIRQRRRNPNWEGEKCTVWHGSERAPIFEPGNTRFIIPIRNPRVRLLSMKKANLAPEAWPEAACRKGVFNAIVALDAPVKLVSYEGFVQDPEGVGKELIAWLGHPWTPFPTTVPGMGTDYLGPIIDGNKKYGG
jgi:hypothetical protein